jgi:hypothetical protein
MDGHLQVKGIFGGGYKASRATREFFVLTIAVHRGTALIY